MIEPNFIIFIDLDSGITVLQNFILKITKKNGLKSKKNRSGPLILSLSPLKRLKGDIIIILTCFL